MDHRLLRVLSCCLLLAGICPGAVADEPAPHAQVISLVVAIPSGAAPADQIRTVALVNLLTQAIDTTNRFVLFQWPPLAQGRKPLVEGAKPPVKVGRDVFPDSRPQASLPVPPTGGPDWHAVLEVFPLVDAGPKLWVRLRVVDARTGALVGMTVAGLDEETVEEAGREFSRYVALVTGNPRRPAQTVAVVPFANVGQSTRLRPLERGIADLVVTQLLVRSGAAWSAGLVEDPPVYKDRFISSSFNGFLPVETNAELVVAARLAHLAPRGTFQVVRRPNLEQLLGELDLVAAGLPGVRPLPPELPTREATYLLRGQIEAGQGVAPTIIVRGSLVSAATRQVLRQFEVAATGQELEDKLCAEIDRLLGELPNPANVPLFTPANQPFAVTALRNQAVLDLQRLVTPHHRAPLPEFSPVWGQPSPPRKDPPPGMMNVPIVIWNPSDVLAETHTPAGSKFNSGRVVLRRSIDRLEAILLIRPDDLGATIALGFCYSLREDGIYHPLKADKLLRQAFALCDARKHVNTAPLVLEYLAQIGFDKSIEELDPVEVPRAIDRLVFAIEHMPVQHYERFGAIVAMLGQRQNTPEQNKALARILAKAAPRAETTDNGFRDKIVAEVSGLALRLASQAQDQPELRGEAVELLSRWASGNDAQLAAAGLHALSQTCASPEDYLCVAGLYEAAAAKITDLTTLLDRRAKAWKLAWAAKNFRLAGQPQRGLDLVLPLALDRPLNDATNGQVGFEIGACYEAVDRPQEALAMYVRTVEEAPQIVNYQPIHACILALGGIPLRSERTVEVQYFPAPSDDHSAAHLASDGVQVFWGGRYGLFAFDRAKEKWTALTGKLGDIKCLAHADGQLWLGDHRQGLWRYDIKSGDCAAIPGRLPWQNITALAPAGDRVYLGIGGHQGRLVELDSQGNVHVFDEKPAPRSAPKHIVVTPSDVWVTTTDGVPVAERRIAGGVHHLSRASKTWVPYAPSEPASPEREPGSTNPSRLFAGESGVWASAPGRELYLWEATPAANQQFAAAWFLPHGKPSYTIDFVAEHHGQVWFGGTPRERFASSGLYRLNRADGTVERFGPWDGFRQVTDHYVYDGLWLDDRLWLATSEGLCLVSERK